MKSFKNFINGEYVDASDGQTTAIIDPSTGQQYGEAALSGAADVDRAMKAASQVLCLPIYPDMVHSDALRVVEVMRAV